MKKTVRRDRADDALSFLEYLLLAVLVIAAAVAGMTFLGSTEGRHGGPTAPSTHSLRLRVAVSRLSSPGSHLIHSARRSEGALSFLPGSVAGCIES